MESLTPRQEEILKWVKTFIRDHGMPPTVREIGTAFDIKSSSVFDLLQALERKGHLRRGDLGGYIPALAIQCSVFDQGNGWGASWFFEKSVLFSACP
jgi:SOS-response transcriptional repressor LexA